VLFGSRKEAALFFASLAGGLIAGAVFSGNAMAGTPEPQTSGSSPPPSTGGGQMRDRDVYDRLRADDMPAFLRDWKPVRVSSGDIEITFFASPDYLGVNDNGGFLRTPMTPATAQRLADELGFQLPTKKMVEAIEQAADRVPFFPQTPASGESRNSIRLWRRQNDQINETSRNRSFVAGHKKDIVVGAPVLRNPNKVIIFGGRYRDGSRVQQQSAVHSSSYVDYSHGVRMIRPDAIVSQAGRSRGMFVRDVLADPALAPLLSDEGATTGWRYSV